MDYNSHIGAGLYIQFSLYFEIIWWMPNYIKLILTKMHKKTFVLSIASVRFEIMTQHSAIECHFQSLNQLSFR